MITCSKSYRDIPLSHRQPNHQGRCSRLHGHSWSITLTFEADELDENGFVVDFGDLHFIEDWIDQHLDHATAVWEKDPKLSELQALEADGSDQDWFSFPVHPVKESPSFFIIPSIQW